MDFKEDIEKLVSDIIKSPKFNVCLNTISDSYANLKQENQIRNAILELLNEKSKASERNNLKAFAEYRNIKKERVDLAIVDCDCLDNKFFIEFKYQFTNDSKQFQKYGSVIRKDFEDRQSDMFILIVSDWEKSDGDEFACKWGISQKLSQYISGGDKWGNEIKLLFDSYKEYSWEYHAYETKKPYLNKYHFYMLKRNS